MVHVVTILKVLMPCVEDQPDIRLWKVLLWQVRDNCRPLSGRRSDLGANANCYTNSIGCKLKCTYLGQPRCVFVCLGCSALLGHDVQTAKAANNDTVINIKHTAFSQLNGKLTCA